jgi:hypothetical protein
MREAVKKNIWLVVEALDESLKLQSHYAALLNMHDGGQRKGFANAEEWIERLEANKAKAKARLVQKAAKEVELLVAKGWTKLDFATALQTLLEEERNG